MTIDSLAIDSHRKFSPSALVFGAASTLAGIYSYFTSRPWIEIGHEPLIFLDKTLGFVNLEQAIHDLPNYAGDLNGYLPHILVGAGVSAIAYSKSKVSGMLVAASFIAGNAAFEVLQSQGLTAISPESDMAGTADIFDILAGTAGPLLAHYNFKDSNTYL